MTTPGGACTSVREGISRAVTGGARTGKAEKIALGQDRVTSLFLQDREQPRDQTLSTKPELGEGGTKLTIIMLNYSNNNVELPLKSKGKTPMGESALRQVVSMVIQLKRADDVATEGCRCNGGNPERGSLRYIDPRH
jgi:hypothetical protein